MVGRRGSEAAEDSAGGGRLQSTQHLCMTDQSTRMHTRVWGGRYFTAAHCYISSDVICNSSCCSAQPP